MGETHEACFNTLPASNKSCIQSTPSSAEHAADIPSKGISYSSSASSKSLLTRTTANTLQQKSSTKNLALLAANFSHTVMQRDSMFWGNSHTCKHKSYQLKSFKYLHEMHINEATTAQSAIACQNSPG